MPLQRSIPIVLFTILPLSACDDGTEPDDPDAELEADDDDVAVVAQPLGPPADANWEYPIARIDLPNGNSIDFFASEIDGATGVVEYGYAGSGSLTSSPALAGATALETFLAVTDDDVEVPAGLLASHRSDPDVGAVELDVAAAHDFGTLPRGWALHAFAENRDSLDVTAPVPVALAPDWCDSGAAFNAEFEADGVKYLSHWRWVGVEGFHSNQRKAHNWRGGQCQVNGSFTAVLGWYPLDASCNHDGFETYVWLDDLAAGGWFVAVWLGENRDWEHYRYPGGTGHIANKWKAATCL
jgi:hypothetical protein